MELPEEFLEILDGECFDRDRLASASSYGIPDSVICNPNSRSELMSIAFSWEFKRM